jgi:hypothetical protein
MIYKVLKIKVFIFFIVISNNLFSQITVKWQLDFKAQQAKVQIYNDSNEKIAFPLDTKSFQAYFNDNYTISQSDWNRNYPFYSLTINAYDNAQNRIETNSSTPYLDLSDFEKQRLNIESINKDYNYKINSWKEKNGLKSDFEAQLNYYLMQNLIFLQPKEKKLFSIPFNLRDIANKNNVIHDSYLLEKDKSYTLFLSLQVRNEIYNYLTPSQKHKLKKYKLFEGSLESNKIQLKQ